MLSICCCSFDHFHPFIHPDEYSRERPAAAVPVDAATAQEEEEEEEAERPIEPISDISIHHINNLMFGDH